MRAGFFIWMLAASAVASAAQPNILFIAVDDLRPELGCYGQSQIHSPNIDALAQRGMVFDRAYCQQAVCKPSRTSLLTGLRPDTTHIYGGHLDFRKTTPNAVTLPQQFKNNGYTAVSFGKIFHGNGPKNDDSWSEPSFMPGPDKYVLKSNLQWVHQRQKEGWDKGLRDKELRRYAHGPAYELADAPDEKYEDGQILTKALQRLDGLAEDAKNGKPFFLAVGFIKPHLPFVAPKKYADLYDLNTIPVPSRAEPKGVTPYTLTNWGEMRVYKDIPDQGTLDDEQTRQLIQAYYACVSFTDANVGRLLDALDQHGLADNTIVVLWGDHGWKLGDYGSWCKHTNMELDTHAPLIVATPSMKAKGQHTRSLVEFVDIYPTLCELADLPTPKILEGRSFAPMLDDANKPGKQAAFSQYPRGDDKYMGYSMRTDRYHLVRWVKRGDAMGDAVAVELYDHANDPGEMNNLAADPINQPLVDKLTDQFRKLLPASSR